MAMVYYCDFYTRNVDLFQKFSTTKEKVKNIGFMYYYKIVYIKNLWGHLRLWLINTTFIPRI